MTDESTVTAAPAAAPARLSGNLGPGAIAFMVVAAAAPLTVVTATSINALVSNGPGIAAAYLFGGLVMLLFVVGFMAMTPHVKRPGAFYAYVTAGLNRAMGVGISFVALMTYACVMFAVFVYFGFITTDLLARWSDGSISFPWWGATLVAIAITAVLGYLNIELSAKVLAVALTLEVVLVLFTSLMVVGKGGGPEGVSATSWLQPDIVFAPGWGLAVLFGVSIFGGIEATAIFRDEARDPRRTIPRATYMAVIGVGVFYVFAIWAFIQAYGVNGFMDALIEHPGDLYFVVAENFVGVFFSQLLSGFLLISMLASVLAYHNILARYFHTLGTRGVLPERLGAVHRTHMSPHVSSVVVTVLMLVLLTGWAVSGSDPMLQIFAWHVAVATLGIVVMFIITSLAVIRFFRRTKADTRVWQTVLAPGLSVIVLVAIMFAAYTNFSMLTGEVPSYVAWVLALFPWIFLGIGLCVAAWLKSTRPVQYESLSDDAPAEGYELGSPSVL
jgi:amino acid transporter